MSAEATPKSSIDGGSSQKQELTAEPFLEKRYPGKRDKYMSYDDYFMAMAFLTAMRSKDPSTQVGSCIVSKDNRIVGVGYNGMPSGIEDNALPWARESPNGELETKYPYVVSAGCNAVLNKNVESCTGCRMYTTLFPGCDCAKVIIQAGIRKVIYASDKHGLLDKFKASRRLFQLAKVEVVHYVSETEEICVPMRYPGDVPPPPAPVELPTPQAKRRRTEGDENRCTTENVA